MTYHMRGFGQSTLEAPRTFGARSSFSPFHKFGLKPAWQMHGLGQLTMDPQTQAALKTCSDKCDQQYGVPSGAPNFIALTSCFASCNLQYPPTVAVPGGGAVTPPPVAPPAMPPPEPVPPVVPGVIDPTEPKPTTPGTQPAKAAAAGDMKLWIIGGAVLLGAVGVYAYTRKQPMRANAKRKGPAAIKRSTKGIKALVRQLDQIERGGISEDEVAEANRLLKQLARKAGG